MRIIGLDASTTTVGIAINEDGKITTAKFLDISKVDKNKEKCYIVVNELKAKIQPEDIINLEAALGAFSFGFTSQQTIIMLSRFNAILEYILNEEFPTNKVNLINVNTARKNVFGKCRIKGVKSKEFVQSQLELMMPDVHKFDITNKRGTPDKRNGDIYDAIVLALYKI